MEAEKLLLNGVMVISGLIAFAAVLILWRLHNRIVRVLSFIVLPELGDMIIEFGGYNALNMDGGGSSTLVIEGENSQPIVLNSPIHGRVPGLERPLANHFGLFARRLGEGS